MSDRRIHAVLALSSMRSNAWRSASSLTTLFVPSTSRLSGALPLRYSKGHDESKHPVTTILA
jgi:hypothetical protein